MSDLSFLDEALLALESAEESVERIVKRASELWSHLESEDWTIKRKAASALGMLAERETDFDLAFPERIVEALSHANSDVRKRAAFAIANFARGRDSCVKLVEANALDTLLGLLDDPRASVVQLAVWAVSKICACRAVPFAKRRGAVLVQVMLFSSRVETVAAAASSLAHLLGGTDGQIGWVLKHLGPDAMDRAVDLLMSEHRPLRWSALRLVGNVLTGTEAQTQVALDSGVLCVLRNMIWCDVDLIAREACWAVSNVAAGSVEQIEEVIGAGFADDLALVMRVRRLDRGWRRVQREAIWAISNACDGGTPLQVSKFVDAGCVDHLCAFLSNRPSDGDAQVALTGLNQMVHKDGAAAMVSFAEIRGAMEEMASRKNEAIASLVKSIERACAHHLTVQKKDR